MWIPNLPTTIISAVTATAGFVCIYKDFHSGVMYDKDVKATDKTAIVTGANTGIGKETAWELAKRGAKVFMACRDMAKCEEARREIVMATENKYVYCRPCDLADLESVREFVERFKKEEPYVHILVNNAGVMEEKHVPTKDGFEQDLGVNHLGHFLLTNLLLDTIKESAPSRIVILSSKAHFKGTIDKEDLNLATQKYDPARAYNQSKLANNLFGLELARRLLDTRVSVAIVDPGLTDSELTRHLPMSRSLTRFFIYPFFWPVMKTPRKAAQSVLHAALDKDTAPGRCHGDYYVDMKKSAPSPLALDFELAQWLWRVSERWTRLDEHRAKMAEQGTKMAEQGIKMSAHSTQRA